MLKNLPIALGALLLAASPAWAAGPITKRQADALPDAGARDVLLGQLGQDLEVVRPPCQMLHRCDLSLYQLRTKPHSTRIPNLCRSDILRPVFEAAGPGSDPPMRARGFNSYSTYFFLKAPSSGPYYEALQEPSPAATAACRQASAAAGAAFGAADEGEAYRGYQTLLRLLAWAPQAADGDCTIRAFQEGAPCGVRLKALKAADLTSVKSCEGPVNGSCDELRFGRLSVTVVQQDKGGGYRIVSVSMNEGPPPTD